MAKVKMDWGLIEWDTATDRATITLMAVEAPMECCREVSVSPQDAVDSLAAASAPSSKSSMVAAFDTPVAAALFTAPGATALAVPPPRFHDPDPPLFLLNEQFRI